MNYLVNSDTFEVSVFDGINIEPILIQPTFPNGDIFESYNEAEIWAQAFVESHDDSVLYFAPNGRNEAPNPKPTAEQIEQRRQAMLLADPTLEGII